MSTIRLLVFLVVIASVIFVSNLSCAPKPAETPTPTPSLPSAPTAPVLSVPANANSVSLIKSECCLPLCLVQHHSEYINK